MIWEPVGVVHSLARSTRLPARVGFFSLSAHPHAASVRNGRKQACWTKARPWSFSGAAGCHNYACGALHNGVLRHNSVTTRHAHKYVCIYVYTYLFVYIYIHTRAYVAIHCIEMHCVALHCIPLHCITLHYITLHYITLHCITLLYTALHSIALHCNALQYIHINIRTYVSVCTHVCMHACIISINTAAYINSDEDMYVRMHVGMSRTDKNHMGTLESK